MSKGHSYRDSHKACDKGKVYDGHYETLPWRRFLWSREQEVLLRILAERFEGKEIHLLDFACGTGRVTSFLESRVTISTGVDVSSSMLAIAREKVKRTAIVQADITVENVLKDKKFNLITAFRFFLNAEPELRVAAIRALAELLADDGYLVFNNHQNLGSPWIKWSYMRHRQKNPEGIYNVMTIEQMKDLAEGAGLEVVQIYPLGFFHPPRVPVWYRLNRAIDRLACRFRCLQRFSESPVAVCRKRLTQGAAVQEGADGVR